MKDHSFESGARVLALRTSRRVCGLPLACVGEVMRPLPIEPLTGAPSFVRGLAIIRGRPTPVVDLDRLLSDATDAMPEPARFVTLKLDSRVVALGVQAVLTIRTLANANFEALPPLWQGVYPSVVAALGTLDNELFLVLESARLLPEEAKNASTQEKRET